MDTAHVDATPRAVRTMLIVEDQKSVLSTLSLVFGQRGHVVLTAENGPVALALIAEQPIEIALIDLHMPGMDGVHVCRSILAHAAERNRSIRVWMMAAAYTEEAAKLCVEAGAMTLLKKPFDCEALAREIESPAPAGPSCPTAAPAALTQAA